MSWDSNGDYVNAESAYFETPEPGETAPFQRFHPSSKANATHFMPRLLMGGDYSGDLVEKSNHRVFLEAFGEYVVDVYGGYGSFGVAIPVPVPQVEPSDDSNVSGGIEEFLEHLNDYPLADEELHGELQLEAEGEAWENWAERDFHSLLFKKFGGTDEREGMIDDLSSERLYEIFRAAAERANEYWQNESGDSMWIDLDRVVAEIEEIDIVG